MILTDEKGVPIERPEPPGPQASLADKLAYLRAFYTYKDAVSACAHRSFEPAFRKALRAPNA